MNSNIHDQRTSLQYFITKTAKMQAKELETILKIFKQKTFQLK